jgi:hypothetical protein
MTRPSTLAREPQRSTCNVEQAREKLCRDKPPSRQHIYNLFNRGDLEGYFVGDGRGLRIFVDSIEAYRLRQTGEALMGAS